LLSDPDKQVLNAYGAYGEKQLYGKTVEGVIRSTFVVDEDGKVSDAGTTSRRPDTSPRCARTSVCRV
jgi:peroxiredoxin